MLNQISSGFSYTPQDNEVHIVSQVFSLKDKGNTNDIASVLTYTSKNELVAFDVTASSNTKST